MRIYDFTYGQLELDNVLTLPATGRWIWNQRKGRVSIPTEVLADGLAPLFKAMSANDNRVAFDEQKWREPNADHDHRRDWRDNAADWCTAFDAFDAARRARRYTARPKRFVYNYPPAPYWNSVKDRTWWYRDCVDEVRRVFTSDRVGSYLAAYCPCGYLDYVGQPIADWSRRFDVLNADYEALRLPVPTVWMLSPFASDNTEPLTINPPEVIYAQVVKLRLAVKPFGIWYPVREDEEPGRVAEDLRVQGDAIAAAVTVNIGDRT